MTKLSCSKKVNREKVFSKCQVSAEEKAKHQAEGEEFYQRCRVIFEQIRPKLMSEHYNWFISIEPDTGDYLIEPNKDNLLLQSRQKYAQKKSFIFRINETGVCGTI